MIKITDSAAKYIKAKSVSGLRLKVKTSGCNGYMYVWSVLETQDENDTVVTHNDAIVVVDKMTLLYVQDSTIDLETSQFSSTLKVENPQVKNTCGCGESFSF